MGFQSFGNGGVTISYLAVNFVVISGLKPYRNVTSIWILSFQTFLMISTEIELFEG